MHFIMLSPGGSHLTGGLQDCMSEQFQGRCCRSIAAPNSRVKVTGSTKGLRVFSFSVLQHCVEYNLGQGSRRWVCYSSLAWRTGSSAAEIKVGWSLEMSRREVYEGFWSCSQGVIVHQTFHQDLWQNWRTKKEKQVMGQSKTWYSAEDNCASPMLSSLPDSFWDTVW